MKYDAVIIGGGLSGLTAGIALARKGLDVVTVSSGQSSLHFNGGAFELLGSVNGHPVTQPLQAVDALPEGHPYRRMGATKMKALASEAKSLLTDAGMRVQGSTDANHWHLTPFGALRPAWLSLDDYPAVEDPARMPWRNVSLIGVEGFIDFYPQYIAYALERRGVTSAIAILPIKGLETLRQSNTECRATAIAQVLDNDPTLLRHLAAGINAASVGSEAVIMPDIFGIRDNLCLQGIRALVDKPLWCVSTLPVSVSGLRTQMMLRRHYERLGGTFLMGDKVLRADISGHAVKAVYTSNLGPEPLEAPHFVIATGSMVSGGLQAGMEAVTEPVIGLDVMHADELPHQRVTYDVFAPQPFMQAGVSVTADGLATLEGEAVTNLHACGALLGGLRPVTNGTGAGVALLTALDAAHQIADKG